MEDVDNVDLPEELVDAIAGFEQKSKQIAESLHASVGASVEARGTPKILYHYTDDIGLKGVIESGNLWLTDIFSLNDPTELSHGVPHAVKILKEMVANGPPETKIFAKHFTNFYQDGLRESAHYFTCSFSDHENDLGQWLAYADNGRGYALGFDAEALASTFMGDIISPDFQGNSTFPIKYDNDIVDVHRQLIEGVFPFISIPFRNADKSLMSTPT
jgi:hypothetical protein